MAVANWLVMDDDDDHIIRLFVFTGVLLICIPIDVNRRGRVVYSVPIHIIMTITFFVVVG